MIAVAVLGWIVYAFVAFVLRSLIQLRQTGSTGFVGLRKGAGALERFAGLSMILAFALSLIGPFVGAPVANTTWLGALLIALATFGTFRAQLEMSRSWRIGVDPDEKTELITHGLFARVRNPIFSFMILASVGFALACPTPLALLAPPLLFVALELQVRLVEEPYLARAHGESYLAYARRVGRFVPGIGRLQHASGEAAQSRS